MIIGAAKSGTTSMANLLANHPEVCFCREKEPEFFSHTIDWKEKLSQYHGLYQPQNNQKLAEASTSYSMIPENNDTHLRLFEYNPNLRLIYLMRDPISRMESHFAHNFVRKRVEKEMEAEVTENPSYVTRSSYHRQVRPYIETFGSNQVLLLVFEEFIKDPKTTMIEVAKFVGIDELPFKNMDEFTKKNQSDNRKILPDGGAGKVFKGLKRIRRFIPEPIISIGLGLFGNSISAKPKFSEELRKTLYKEVETEIKGIEELLGHKIESWSNYEA